MDPLLLIHGTGGEAASWSDVVPLLSSRHRVIAYNRRGYGRPHAAHAEDARAILDERAPGEAALVVGSSSGAIIALQLALLHPTRVRALVLAEPPLWMARAGDVRMLAGMLGYVARELIRRRRDAVASFFRTVTRYRDGGTGFDAMSAERRERALAHADDVAAEIRIGTGEDLTPDKLRAIRCPATLLLGARSAPIFERQGKKLAAVLPQLRTVTIAGAGHLMMMEQPAAFADAVLAADQY